MKDLLGYWKESPPVHVLVAGYLGLKPNRQPAKEATEEDILAIAAMFGQG